MPKTDLKTGSTEAPSIALVSSRPSLIVRRLFSTLGGPAVVIIFLTMFTAGILLLVEIVSALLGFKLSRSITRAVADLYEGTRKVQSGDLSHRIPIRKTRDQLSELSGSFNAMTERVEELIREVKEKERLENELEIAESAVAIVSKGIRQ